MALIFIGAVGYLVGKPMVEFVREPERFRAWVDSSGFVSRVIFVGMVIFQLIIALIPGEPLEMGAGYAFGAWEGTDVYKRQPVRCAQASAPRASAPVPPPAPRRCASAPARRRSPRRL